MLRECPKRVGEGREIATMRRLIILQLKIQNTNFQNLLKASNRWSIILGGKLMSNTFIKFSR